MAHIAENVSVKAKDEKGTKWAEKPPKEEARLERGGSRSLEVVCVLKSRGTGSVEVRKTMSKESAERAVYALELSLKETCLTVELTRELPKIAVKRSTDSGSLHSLSDWVVVMSLIGEW